MVLEREEVVAFLKMARSDMSVEDWKDADLITVLSWALPSYQSWLNNGLIPKRFTINLDETK